jgi:hypothetical protein
MHNRRRLLPHVPSAWPHWLCVQVTDTQMARTTFVGGCVGGACGKESRNKLMPINNANPTLCKCIVFPPILARLASGIPVGIFTRCKGKPCKSNFSHGSTGRSSYPT